MNETPQGLFGLADDEDLLSVGLTSKQPHVRCMARGVASGFPQAVAKWASAEIARGTSEATVLYALAQLQVQTFASVAAQVLKPGGDEHAVELYLELVNDRMQKHISLCREGIPS